MQLLARLFLLFLLVNGGLNSHNTIQFFLSANSPVLGLSVGGSGFPHNHYSYLSTKICYIRTYWLKRNAERIQRCTQHISIQNCSTFFLK
jgi:hypothetical protein